MKSKIFFFIFKFNYRKQTFNNFLKIKKIKNYYIFDFSGIFKYYLFGFPLYLMACIFKSIFKNFTFITCDARPQLKFNSINIWFGGTSYKVPDKYKNFNNNCFVIENFSKNEKNLIHLYPFKSLYPNFRSDRNVIYIGTINILEDQRIDNLWNLEKDNIFKNLSIIDNKELWVKYNLFSEPRFNYFYIQLKERLRLNLIIELNKLYKSKLILVGSAFKKYFSSSYNDEYDVKKITNLYNGNLCLDFGSKWGSGIVYPRSSQIVECGGLLVQSKQSNNNYDKIDSNSLCTFNSVDEMKKILKKLFEDDHFFKDQFKKQDKIFRNIENNYSTFSKIYEIARLNNE